MKLSEKRLELHELLCQILGSRNVYYQPPETIKMSYPAIRYSLEDIDKIHADDDSYLLNLRYQIIVIGKDPDTNLVDKLLKLKYCSYDRHYEQNNLNHDVFTLYY